MSGQFTGSGGSFVVSPAGFDSLTLSGKTPTSGNRMAIVLSCNGMDVLHLYGREGAAQETVAADTPAKKGSDRPKATELTDNAEPAETIQEDDQPAKPGLLSALKGKLAKDQAEGEEPEGEKKTFELQPLDPKIKLLVLGALLLAAIFDLLYMLSKPKE